MANISYGVNILPKINNTYTLGNSDYKWNIFANTLNGVSLTNIITDIQIDGTSIVNNNVATIPIATASTLGVVSNGGMGVGINSSGQLYINYATDAGIKAGTSAYNAITAGYQHKSVFYGLAKAAGDSTQSASSNAVGVYTDEALAAIQNLLNVSSKNNPVFTGSISLGRASNSTVGTDSFALGYSVTASGGNSIAIGYQTVAYGAQSHAEGISSVAYGNSSYAIGQNTTALYPATFVCGRNNQAPSIPGWVSGTSYSIGDKVLYGGYVLKCKEANSDSGTSPTVSKWDQDYDELFIVGNGTDDNHPSNALTLNDNGDLYIASDVYVQANTSGTSGTKLINATDYATSSVPGIVMPKSTLGIYIDTSNGEISINKATDDLIKGGSNLYRPIVPSNQHTSVFYGLAKAAGDSTQSSSSNSVGNYTANAKAVIGDMLGYDGRPWELICEDTFTNAEEAHHEITVDGEGNAFDLTDIIFLFETPRSSTIASSKGSYGQVWFYYGTGSNDYVAPEPGAWSQAVDTAAHGFVIRITQEPGGLLFCQETAQTTNTNSAAWRSRFVGGLAGAAQGVKMVPETRHFTKISIRTVTGLGHYKLIGKRALT